MPLDSLQDFDQRLTRFMANECPDCAAPSSKLGTVAWPYCQKCHDEFEADEKIDG